MRVVRGSLRSKIFINNNSFSVIVVHSTINNFTQFGIFTRFMLYVSVVFVLFFLAVCSLPTEVSFNYQTKGILLFTKALTNMPFEISESVL